MRTRQIVGLILGILTVPVLIVGLMDPIEGGVALLVGGALVVIVFLVSRVPMPRLLWIAWLSAVAFGAASLIAVPQRFDWIPSTGVRAEIASRRSSVDGAAVERISTPALAALMHAPSGELTLLTPAVARE